MESLLAFCWICALCHCAKLQANKARMSKGTNWIWCYRALFLSEIKRKSNGFKKKSKGNRRDQKGIKRNQKDIKRKPERNRRKSKRTERKSKGMESQGNQKKSKRTKGRSKGNQQGSKGSQKDIKRNQKEKEIKVAPSTSLKKPLLLAQDLAFGGILMSEPQMAQCQPMHTVGFNSFSKSHQYLGCPAPFSAAGTLLQCPDS